MTINDPVFTKFQVRRSPDQFSLSVPNPKMVMVNMDYGPVQCLEGSMVAYQGDVRFKKKYQGAGRTLKSSITGTSVSLMEASGHGVLFLANDAANALIMYLDDDSVSVSGSSIIAFSSSLRWDVERVQGKNLKQLIGGVLADGFFSISLTGTGYVAVAARGEVLALNVSDATTFVSPKAAILWTSGVTLGVRTDIGGLGTMFRGGTGETWQVAFNGEGYVLIQPYEGVKGNQLWPTPP